MLENYSGAIRALVGGRDFGHSQFNRATQSKRPMGSVFKPLVYGTAFERGLFPGMLISDAALAPGEIPWDKIGWNPQNADGVYGGRLPVETGLIQSRNTLTARVGEWAGIDTVIAMMEHEDWIEITNQAQAVRQRIATGTWRRPAVALAASVLLTIRGRLPKGDRMRG
jgi:membrane carboxypeptidase/penicillin-binding protein